jgi:hypothetical protein
MLKIFTNSEHIAAEVIAVADGSSPAVVVWTSLSMNMAPAHGSSDESSANGEAADAEG